MTKILWKKISTLSENLLQMLVGEEVRKQEKS